MEDEDTFQFLESDETEDKEKKGLLSGETITTRLSVINEFEDVQYQEEYK